MREIGLAENRLASQEPLCSTQYLSTSVLRSQYGYFLCQCNNTAAKYQNEIKYTLRQKQLVYTLLI